GTHAIAPGFHPGANSTSCEDLGPLGGLADLISSSILNYTLQIMTYIIALELIWQQQKPSPS
ncbi:hypothetical protein ACJX0J_021837, partial [Zea mays]